MTVILDYGVGNLFSLSSSLKAIGCANVISRDAAQVAAAHRIILPGVGAFGDAMEKLQATGLIPVLNEQVAFGVPLLGICLGMQLLFEKSYEFGEHAGLGYIRGSVCPMDPDLQDRGISLKIPHMGWNALHFRQANCPILQNSREGEFVYFVHSFYAKDCGEAVAAEAEYGITVPGVVANRNVYGCQFHPEKSGDAGLRILRTFAAL